MGVVQPSRFQNHGSRQLSATLSAHVANLFSVKLTEKEISILKKDMGNIHGVDEDSERTYVEVWSLSDIIKHNLVDWTNLGMILSVIKSNS